jgi:hypothetical protein
MREREERERDPQGGRKMHVVWMRGVKDSLRCCWVLEEKTNPKSYSQSEKGLGYISAQYQMLVRLLIVRYEPRIGK